MGRSQLPETRRKISAALRGREATAGAFKVGNDDRRKVVHKEDCQCPWHNGFRKAKIPLSLILVANSSYHKRQSIKRRLVEEGIKENRCEDCGIGPEWNDKPLVLQLDHINGINDDFRIENLAILCPNCHTQTPTFAGRNNRRGVA